MTPKMLKKMLRSPPLVLTTSGPPSAITLSWGVRLTGVDCMPASALQVYRLKYFDNLLEQYQAAQEKAQSEGKSVPNYDPNMLKAQANISSKSPMGIVWVSLPPQQLLSCLISNRFACTAMCT